MDKKSHPTRPISWNEVSESHLATPALITHGKSEKGLLIDMKSVTMKLKPFMTVIAVLLALTLLTACGSLFGGMLGNSGNVEGELGAILGALMDLSEEETEALIAGGTQRESQGGSQSGGQSESGKTQEEFEYGNGKDYINMHLTGDYSITFRIYTSSSEEYSDLVFMRTSEGYYIDTITNKVMYIKNGDTYDTYLSGNDGFYLVDFLEPKTEEEVEKTNSMVYSYMTQYDGASGLNKTGSETVAGRSCDVYKGGAVGFGMAIGASYYIDKETGVCMKFTYDVATEGGMGSMTFECVEFKTSGVKLPAYN